MGVTVSADRLTVAEQNRLAELELTIETKIGSFVEVGAALTEIRDGRLYRADYLTFDRYCQERYGIGRNYANRLIGSSSVVSNLVPIGTIPTNEAQARPLTKLPPEQQIVAWQLALNEAGNRPVTGAIVADAVKHIVGEPEKTGPDFNAHIRAAIVVMRLVVERKQMTTAELAIELRCTHSGVHKLLDNITRYVPIRQLDCGSWITSLSATANGTQLEVSAA